MEDLVVKYDATVRNSLGDIVQFAYGEDGMDGSFIEGLSLISFLLLLLLQHGPIGQKLAYMRMDNAKFEDTYRLNILTPGALDSYMVRSSIQCW